MDIRELYDILKLLPLIPSMVGSKVLVRIEHVEGSACSSTRTHQLPLALCFFVAVDVIFAIVSFHSPAFGLILTEAGSTEKLVQRVMEVTDQQNVSQIHGQNYNGT